MNKIVTLMAIEGFLGRNTFLFCEGFFFSFGMVDFLARTLFSIETNFFLGDGNFNNNSSVFCCDAFMRKKDWGGGRIKNAVSLRLFLFPFLFAMMPPSFI